MADITAPQPPTYGPPSYAPVASVAATGTASRPKTPLRDLVFGWRAALAVLVAGIVIGGLVGSAITLIADHANRPATPTRSGTGFGGFSPYGQGQPGQLGQQSQQGGSGS